MEQMLENISSASGKKKVKTLPYYKKIPGTSIALTALKVCRPFCKPLDFRM